MDAPPEGWVHVAPHGAPMMGCLPCKTPLPGARVALADAWSASMAIKVAKQELGSLVGVINLAPTFHDNRDLAWGAGVRYVPVNCRPPNSARDQPPSEESFHEFYIAYRELTAIGGVIVHCKLGLNRTMYMLCRAAIEDGADPHEAMAMADAARPGALFKTWYRAALCARVGLPPPPPQPWPEWHEAGRFIARLPPGLRAEIASRPVSSFFFENYL